jgi:Domain of unknown function (DUF1906)
MLLGAIFLAGCLALLRARVPNSFQTTRSAGSLSRNYLGFDRNRYPGDAVLGLLRETFSFCGYWLNVPPGEASNTWEGNREVLTSSGFGFLVLFNGRLDRELKSLSNSKTLGTRDASIAVDAAKKEGFPVGTIIFLDQEEGGRMLTEQRAYVYAWVDGVNASGYRAGVYCSGIPAKETGGTTVITANDLRDNADGTGQPFAGRKSHIPIRLIRSWLYRTGYPLYLLVSTTCVACSVASCSATENPSARRSIPGNSASP